MKLVCGRAACRDAFATGGGEFLRAARFQQDCNETQVGVWQPRVLAEADAPMALDQCSDLPNRHAAVRRNRYHAKSCWEDESKPVIHSASDTLQAELLAQLNSVSPAKKQALPQDVADWIGNQMSLHVAAREAEWSGREIYVALPQPGGECLAQHRSRDRRGSVRANRSWLDFLSQRPAQGPKYRFRLVGFFQRVRHRLRRVLRHGTGPSAVAVQRAAIHVAAGGPWARNPRAARNLFHPLRWRCVLVFR